MAIEITDEMLALAWKTFRGDRKGPLMGPGPGFKEALAALSPLIEAQVSVLVPPLPRYDYCKPRQFVLICSYCGDDTPGCTDQTPCADCLAMCNVFGEDGTYLRQLGEAVSPDLAQARAAAIEEAARLRGLLAECRALLPGNGSPSTLVARIDKALASRPVSEREGSDTAPAPAKCGCVPGDCAAETDGQPCGRTAPAPAISSGKMICKCKTHLCANELYPGEAENARVAGRLCRREAALAATADRPATPPGYEPYTPATVQAIRETCSTPASKNKVGEA